MSETYSRRDVLVKSAAAGSSLLATALFAACGPRKDNESLFFEEIRSLPLSEQLRRVDQLYSTTPLNKEVAVNYVAPLWVRAYVQFAGSGLTPEHIMQNVMLSYDISQRKAQEQTPGKVPINPVKRTVGKVEFNFGAFGSNQIIRHPEVEVDEKVPGIVYLRSGFTHELGNFDTAMREDRALGKVINDNSIVTPRLKYPDLLVFNGFTFTEINPDESYSVYFGRFDQMATDVVSSYVASREGLPVVMVYPRASYLRDTLDWIQFSSDDYLAMHRGSDVSGFALELGRISQRMKKVVANDDKALVDGLRIMRIFNSANLLELATFYPGIKEEVLDKPVRLIR